MSDEYHSEVLAEGLLPSSTGSLYTAASGKRVILISMDFVNEDTVMRMFNVYIKKAGGTRRRICPKDLELDQENHAQEDIKHVLGPGDALEGDCDVAGKISYVIKGAIT